MVRERQQGLRRSPQGEVLDLVALVLARGPRELEPQEEHVGVGGLLDVVDEGGGGGGLPQRLSEEEDGPAMLRSRTAHGGTALDGSMDLDGGKVPGGGRGQGDGKALDDDKDLDGIHGGRLRACTLRDGRVEVVEVVDGGRDQCARARGRELSRGGGVQLEHGVLAPWQGRGRSDGSGGGVQDGGAGGGDEEGVGEGLLVQGHLPRVQSHGSQAHEPPRRTPDQQGGVGQGGGGGGDGGGDGCLHKEPHGHLWPRRALLPEKS